MESSVAVVDALDFLDPQPIQFVANGYVVEVEPLALFKWFRFERAEEEAIKLLLSLDVCQGLSAFVENMEAVSGFQFDSVTLENALAAFALLTEENQCQYMDPFFIEALESARKSRRGELVYHEDDLSGRSIFDLVLVLARRFSMSDIRSMSPAMAFLAYQYVLDDQAEDRSISFYQSELGYEKKKSGSGKNVKFKLKALPNPYTTPWLMLREKAIRQRFIEAVQERPAPRSMLIKYPDKVVDLSKRKRRRVNVQ